MIAGTMMTLIENNKRKIGDFDIASPETIEKHLSNHHKDSTLLEHVQDLLFGG